MFETAATKEAKTRVLKIKDVSPDIFKLLLAYIYTGQFDERMKEEAEELLVAADKYTLLELKVIILVL
jgi:hypothetical protein